VSQQRLVDRQVGQIRLHRGPLLGIQRLARLDGVERRRRVTRVVSEGIGRQTRWEVVAHTPTVRSPAGIALAVTDPVGVASGAAARCDGDTDNGQAKDEWCGPSR
jgi:hypothetical protein